MKCLTYILILFSLSLSSQSLAYYFNTGFGPGYIFFGNAPGQKIGMNGNLGLSVCYQPKNKIMMINAAIDRVRNSYYTKINYRGSINVDQVSWRFQTDAMMRLKKHMYLRVGLTYSKLDHSDISVSYKNQGAAWYGYGSSYMNDGYHGAQWQSGALTGLCFPLNVKRRVLRIGFSIYQNVSGIVSSQYYFDNTINSQAALVFTGKEKPTTLLLTFDIGFVRAKKKESQE